MEATSAFLKIPKPSVGIMCAAITLSRRNLSYLPSTMTGYGIFKRSVISTSDQAKNQNERAKRDTVNAKGRKAVLFYKIH